jgi:Fuseless
MLDNVLPADAIEAGVLSILLGCLTIGIAHSVRLTAPLDSRQPTQTEMIRERCFSYALAWAGILSWHGVWELWEELTGDGLASGVLCHVAPLAALFAMRAFRSTIAPPACVALDDDAAGVEVGTLGSALRARGLSSLWER